MSKTEDEYWMQRALELGREGVGFTSPNPPVGAILVKEGREIGAGFHRGPGRPHAEIEAFHAARKQDPLAVQGATLYVTLEPCSTRGRTGACTEAIKREKVGRVVFGSVDPNPAHAGAAVSLLEEAGIEVIQGILAAECEHLIRAFSKVQRTGLPWVIAKTAMSLDGRITRPPGEGQWLSSPASREQVQQIRFGVDGIITSGKTVRDDDPRLTLRLPDLPEEKRQPWRIILTSKQNGVPAGSKVLTDENRDRTLVFEGRRLESVMRELVTERDVQSLLVEAGGRLLGRLVDEAWVDELVVYLAPMITGGAAAAVCGEGVAGLSERWGLTNVMFEKLGNDVCLRGLMQQEGTPLER